MLIFLLLIVTSAAFGQISFDPICLYDEPETCYELSDVITTHDGNLMIAWSVWTSARLGSKVHVFSPEGEPLSEPIAVVDLPLSALQCKPKSQITERDDGAWAALTIYS